MSHFSILNSTYFSTVGVGKPEGLKMVIIFYLVFYIYSKINTKKFRSVIRYQCFMFMAWLLVF